ncbi:cell envelope-related transcriptional attenuator [Caldalkalibacillus thermarum TA2.A1]|uniref:Cell envelope-related transcriptional attenuator n=1 Tax=Caldalkalibacillus thermarum (strain TA2.A1) TaxID=986075 RepID=F5L994_CALTT|nr:LCP family protein [Caldalkalibacillus thermarum]EGL82036.1 cell envelope-related transcriptional attenuator [Caldalkalibacillus thermarum TA2.A1]QZT34045.1 LCP family protein [Caldalkalibacillus thermarum TA2.A1]
MSRVKIFLLIVLLITLVGVAGSVVYFGAYAQQVWNQIHEERDDNGDDEKKEKPAITEPFTILILGVDNDGGRLEGRSDVIMLAVIDPKQEQINLLSIPRDTYTYFPTQGRYDKINHAYAYGINTAIKTIEHFVGVPIDYYVTLNFDAFRDFVDLMGGVKINAERDMFHQNSRVTIDIRQGEQILNGEEALFYVRFRRDAEGDFGRMRRQQQMVRALLDQTLNLRTVGSINQILSIIGENVRTDIPFSKVIKLIKQFSNITGDNVNSMTVNGESERINGIWYVMVSEEEQRRVQQEMRRLLGLTEDVKYHSISIEQLN